MKQYQNKRTSSLWIKNASITVPVFAKLQYPASLILICLLTLSAGCKKANQEVKGEMFISTEGGDTKRVSGALIGFYQRQQLEQSITQSSKTAMADIPPYDAEIKRLTRAIDDLSQEISNETGGTTALYEAQGNLMAATRGLKTTWENLRDAWPHASYYFGLFPKPEFETRTDADGKFSIELPPGDWIMVAESKRKVGASEEWYYWTYPVKSPAGNILSNHNLVTSDDQDSILKTRIARKPAPPIQ